MPNKHTKHTQLIKPKLGRFARNEWAFIGAPCSTIRDLVERLAQQSGQEILYIDETHDETEKVGKVGIIKKIRKEGLLQTFQPWSKNHIFSVSNDYDFVFVNGNHFKAEQQIVLLDPRKKESLRKKLDRLTNVKAYITTEAVKVPYEFLKDAAGSDVPIISIQEVDKIWQLIKSDFAVPKLKGLILAGGKSTRMGEDKGAIAYHGLGHARYMYELLEKMGIDCYLSCRQEQIAEYMDLQIVEDQFLGLGPFGAIASAFRSDPNSAWLVVPCDLPLLDRSHLATLTSKRNSNKFATAFLNQETQFPEPLISIWEPKMYQQMLNFLAQGYSCPRKVLINSDVELVEIHNQDFMMNVNTQEERRKAQSIIEEK